jgi:hypothetical protein
MTSEDHISCSIQSLEITKIYEVLKPKNRQLLVAKSNFIHSEMFVLFNTRMEYWGSWEFIELKEKRSSVNAAG